MKKRSPKSTRKNMREEKARIRREISDTQKIKEEIGKLYQNVIIKKQKVGVTRPNNKRIEPNSIELIR